MDKRLRRIRTVLDADLAGLRLSYKSAGTGGHGARRFVFQRQCVFENLGVNT